MIPPSPIFSILEASSDFLVANAEIILGLINISAFI